MGPVLATEGELCQTVSRTASRQCVEDNGAGTVASNDGKQTDVLIGVQYPTLWYCLAIWVLKYVETGTSLYVGPKRQTKLVQPFQGENQKRKIMAR